jgi:hypothetical protein
VPASNIPAHETHHDDVTMRAFPHGVLTQPPAGDQDDAGELLVLATATDEPVSRLRAGEAMSAVLLAATNFRLATCPLSQVLEIEATRELVRTRVLDGSASPRSSCASDGPRGELTPTGYFPARLGRGLHTVQAGGRLTEARAPEQRRGTGPRRG